MTAEHPIAAAAGAAAAVPRRGAASRRSGGAEGPARRTSRTRSSASPAIETSLPPSSASATDQTTSSDAPIGGEAAPARRTTARTRKPPSRLLSHSPPPARPSYTKAARSGPSPDAATPVPSAGSPAAPAPRQPRVTYGLAPRQPKLEDVEKEEEIEELGPGKRKRRPSSFAQPPSTITRGMPSSSVNGGAVSDGNIRLKVRLTSKSISPGIAEEAGTSPSAATASTQARIRRSASSTSLRKSTGQLPYADMLPLPVASMSAPAAVPSFHFSGMAGVGVGSGYDSDGGVASARALLMAEPDEDAEDSDFAGPTPERLRAPSGSRIGGLAHFNSRTSPLKGLHFGASSTPLEPPPLLSRDCHGNLLRPRGAHARSHTTGALLTGAQQQLLGESSGLSVTWGRSTVLARGQPSYFVGNGAVAAEDSDADGDDEDDFHKAMLDAGDFEEALVATPKATVAAREWERKKRLAQGGMPATHSSDEDDTPATTPRSPQSCAELPEQRRASQPASPNRPASPAEDAKGKSAPAASRVADAVFAHALPPSSRRAHTHAGALTLSLPYDESDVPTSSAGSKDVNGVAIARGATPLLERRWRAASVTASPSNAAGDAKAATAPASGGLGLVEGAADAEADAVPSALLSPGHALLGLAPAHRSGEGVTASPFVAAALGPGSPAPLLLLPPSLTSSNSYKATRMNRTEDESGRASPRARLTSAAAAAAAAGKPLTSRRAESPDAWQEGLRSVSPHSSLSARLSGDAASDAEDDDDAFGPPEAMCLSDLDRAWDRSVLRKQGQLAAASQACTPIASDVEEYATPGADVEPVSGPNTRSPSPQLPIAKCSAKRSALAPAVEVDMPRKARKTEEQASPQQHGKADVVPITPSRASRRSAPTSASRGSRTGARKS